MGGGTVECQNAVFCILSLPSLPSVRVPAMGKFKPFLFGALLGAGTAVCALQFHVVQSNEGFRVIPRTPQPSLGLAYADVRNWSAETWADRPELVRALVAHGSTDLVASTVAGSVVDSVSAESSTLDQLRGFLNETAAGVQPNDSSGLITIPDRVPSPDDVGEMFQLRFPDDAKRNALGRSAALEPSTTATDIARRDLPSIDEVFGTGAGGFSPIEKPSTVPQPIAPPSNPVTSNEFDPASEADALESLLFGAGETEGESVDGGASDADAGFGVFEEITSALENRAEETLKRATSGLQQEADRALADSTNSMDRFVRSQIEQSVPESVSGMFSEDSPLKPLADKAIESANLPPAIQAIRNGFDPFIE